jgi:DNA-binding IscR family transcriptional regulator
VCEGEACIFGGLLGDLSSQVKEYLSQTKLPELAGRVGKLESVGSGNGKNS